MNKIVMGFILVFFALTGFSCVKAHASTSVDEYQGLREAILAQVAETEGWCDQPRKALKPGEFTVDWSRDEQGRCIIQTLRTREPNGQEQK